MKSRPLTGILFYRVEKIYGRFLFDLQSAQDFKGFGESEKLNCFQQRSSLQKRFICFRKAQPDQTILIESTVKP